MGIYHSSSPPSLLSRFQISFRLRFLIIGASVSLILFAVFVFNTRYGFNRAGGEGTFLKKYTPESCPSSWSPVSTFTGHENSTHRGNVEWEFVSSRDGGNYGLSDSQCKTAFPKLFVEIEKSVFLRRDKNKPITFKELNTRKVEDGMVRGLINRGDLYIVEFGDMPYTYSRAKSTLNSLHRALTSISDRHELPSVEFIFTAEDFVDDEHNNNKNGKGPIWAYSKRDEDDAVWLMPDFGYWSWPEVKIGAYRDVRRRIAAVDEEIPDFQSKKKQLLWRGSLATAPEVRGKLLKQTRGKHWASVRVLDWDDEDDIRYNLLPMEEHCRYMFLAHTEGRSFSGRGKYLQNCRSVMMAQRLIWREAHHAALIPSGPEANYVEVARDWSDLETKIEFLIDNPDVAERIANQGVGTFRDRYLTPAAEACYWRELIRRYAEVCDFEPRVYEDDGKKGKKLRGVPFESWVLNR